MRKISATKMKSDSMAVGCECFFFYHVFFVAFVFYRVDAAGGRGSATCITCREQHLN